MLDISPDEYKSENILSQKELLQKLEDLKKQGKKIGFCSGSFDLLHPGHITHLISAKKMCDILVVSIARDSFSSKKHCARGRPIFSHDMRAFMIGNLKPVDFVILDDGQPEILEIVKPDVYIKGKDYADEAVPNIIAQKRMMEEMGGKIDYTNDEKLSTTDIIRYIKEEVD